MTRTRDSLCAGRLLMVCCVFSLIGSGDAVPGDCTPIEAGSYLIDPRINYEDTELRPDAQKAATKAAGVALASPECASCAAAYLAPDDCVVSTFEDCSPSRHDLMDNCVGVSGTIVEQSDFSADDLALASGTVAYGELNVCLGWSTSGRCQASVAWKLASRARFRGTHIAATAHIVYACCARVAAWRQRHS